MKQRTDPSVFIIESLELDDEQHERHEGELLRRHLSLAAMKSRYVYLRTKKELQAFLAEFASSRFRYLHISCHGNESEVGLTLDSISSREFARTLESSLSKRRLFLSACSIANEQLAREIFAHCSGCYSVVGPAQNIGFAEAAIFWASLYHLMFEKDGQRMKRSGLKDAMQKLHNIYGIRMNGFFSDEDEEDGFEIFQTR